MPVHDNHGEEVDDDFVDGSVPFEEQVMGKLDAGPIADEINNLPLGQREAFLRATLGGQKYEEIADTMHLSLGTVRSRINRARQSLQARLPQYTQPQAKTKGKGRLS